ncbi:MAG: CatB-related O-acetyltransferase [Bacteroidales bacterium]
MKSFRNLISKGKSFLKREILRTSPPFLIKECVNILEVGRHSFHNGGFTVKGYGECRIGNFVAIGSGVTLILNNHNIGFPSLQYRFYNHYFGKLPFIPQGSKIIIGNDVWIGDNAIVLPGVTVGTGAIIGAGAVVTKDIAPYSIVAGNPAKLIKMRFSQEAIERLLESKWWEWSDTKIKENREFFFTKIS